MIGYSVFPGDAGRVASESLIYIPCLASSVGFLFSSNLMLPTSEAGGFEILHVFISRNDGNVSKRWKVTQSSGSQQRPLLSYILLILCSGSEGNFTIFNYFLSVAIFSLYNVLTVFYFVPSKGLLVHLLLSFSPFF